MKKSNSSPKARLGEPTHKFNVGQRVRVKPEIVDRFEGLSDDLGVVIKLGTSVRIDEGTYKLGKVKGLAGFTYHVRILATKEVTWFWESELEKA